MKKIVVFITVLSFCIFSCSGSKDPGAGRSMAAGEDAGTDKPAGELEISEKELADKTELVRQAKNGYTPEGLALEDRLLFPPAIRSHAWGYYNFLVASNSLIYFSRSADYKPRKVDLVLNGDGFYTFNYSFQKTEQHEIKTETFFIEEYFIGGGDIALDIYPRFLSYDFDVFPPPEELMKGHDHPLRFFLWEDGIKSVHASSVLHEKNGEEEIVYDESNLLQSIYEIHDSGPQYNFFMKRVWAEGADGDGLGEFLEIEFSRETDHMLVLNGYVNIFNRELFKANNRVRTAVIKSKRPDFTIRYEFDDVVKFSEIRFPEKTESVTFTIEEVYKGTKYADTCISAILLRQQSGLPEFYFVKGTPEYEKIVDGIIKTLITRGVLP